MKEIKIIGIIIVGFMLTSSLSSIINANQIDNHPSLVIHETQMFSPPMIDESNTVDTISIDIPEVNNVLTQPGQPILPAETKLFTFPLNTHIQEVKIHHGEIIDLPITQSIESSPIPLPYDMDVIETNPLLQSLLQDDDGYDFQGFYPDSWYTYSIRVGLDEDNVRKTFVTVTTYPVRYSNDDSLIQYCQNIDIEISYQLPPPSSQVSEEYDFLIIAASAYLDELEPFVTHKENLGISTKLVSIDDIDTTGSDQQEQIKYFIKQAIEQWNITSVLLVGGYRSYFGFNKPSLQIPLRYVDLDDGGETDFISDLYYADIYAYDSDTGTMVFSSWDTDNDGKYGEWYYITDDITDKQDDVDLIPDVNLGRWACRTEEEASIMVNKVITYETTSHENEDWFNRMIVLTGDDFQDQQMLDIAWDTHNLSGTFTIHAISTNTNNEEGVENVVTVMVDHTQASSITFSENDQETTNYIYPNIPVAEITVPSEGNILGSNDVYVESPPDAYIGYRWTPINYTDEILKIQGKSYNPQPFTETPINTTLTVWITDEADQVVFGPIERESGEYFEGEWATQKAIDFMPEDFEFLRLWTSMGTFHGTDLDVHDAIDSVVQQLSQGSGFMYIAGHANPMVYANHYPGIPGGRSNGDIVGLTQFNPFRGLSPSEMFPLMNLQNSEKQPVLVLSGCHPCELDVSFLRLLSEGKYAIWYGTYGWESLGWWLTRLEDRGMIATLGPTALGYGGIGQWGTKTLGGWLWPEFFRQYNEEGETIIGETWTQTLKSYIFEFGPNLDLWDTKTVEEMVLLGDPTLQIG